MKIQDTRLLHSIEQEDLRSKAVKAVLDGTKQVEVAKNLGVTRQAVGKWMKTYREGGEKALKAKQRGRPKGGALLPWQAAQIVKTVVDHYPDQLNLPFYLWTREAVAQFMENRFGIQLSIWSVGRYLANWGFTPRRTVCHAFEKGPEEVGRWLKEEYPSIHKQAKREKARIFWGTIGNSYGRHGHMSVIPGIGQGFGCNMISAITNQGQLNFMVFKERFRFDVFREFLKRLAPQSKRKVFLIVDGHPVHCSTKIKNWAEKNVEHIHLFFLPGYIQVLNPDEMLNQDVNSNAVGRERARS